jgi:hypothetical protein
LIIKYGMPHNTHITANNSRACRLMSPQNHSRRPTERGGPGPFFPKQSLISDVVDGVNAVRARA